MPTSLNEVKERLRASEYRLTPQRELILGVLFENSDEHMTADELYRRVKERNADVGLATVYRMLDLLFDMGLINRLDSGEGRSRYEMRPVGQKHYHHHLICLGCGSITEFAEAGPGVGDGLDIIEQTVSRQNDFLVTDHSLRLYGYCRECRTDQAGRDANPVEQGN